MEFTSKIKKLKKIKMHLELQEIREYSQTCIERSPLGQRKCGILGQVTS